MNTTSGDSEARRRAVEAAECSFVMEASAGTGKTHTLIGRILHLILEKGPQGQPLRLADICAITFTEKAAEEMKTRLRLELEKRLEETGASGVGERIIQALSDLETAAVSTFHSFAAGLLKERPIEAGIDPGFSALDDIQCKFFFREVWDAWVSAALKRRDPSLEKALRGGFSLQSLKSLAKNLRDNWLTIRDLRCAAPDEEKIALEIKNRLDVGRGFMRSLINDPADKLAGFLADALAWLENPDPAAEVLKKPGSAGSKNNWTGGKDTVEKIRDFLKEVVELQISFQHIPERRFMYETVQWLCADFIRGVWEKKKAAAGYLDFDDQLYLARELLRRHDGVRFEFQERYKTLLVDEFQDTDPIQLEIVLLLTSKRGDSRPEPGRLFIVGDPKQSIYRFRGADIETYLGLAREENLRSLGLDLLTINRNFRSVPSILRFVDEAFADVIRVPEDGNYQSSYTAFNDEGARREEPSAPSVHILDDSVYIPDDAAAESIERKTEELVEIEAERIAKLISLTRDSELYQVCDANGSRRPARYGDIAVLLPTLTHVDALEDALREAGVPYVLEGGRLYYTRSEVVSAVTALSAIANPGDEIALCGTLKSVFFGISDEDLLQARADGITLDYRHPAPQNSPFYAPFEILKRLHDRRHERPASETFETLLQETGAREILTVRGRQHLANLTKISRALRAIEGRNGFSRTIELLSIMEKEELDESESRLAEARSDAVRVMTIHKSKGLDFPLVIAASLGLQKKAQSKTLLADRHKLKMFAVKTGSQEAGRRTEGWEELVEGDRRRADAELIRLLYVALTRARDHLIISTHTCKREKIEEIEAASIPSIASVPDVSGTRLAPLKTVLRKCFFSNNSLARLIDIKRLDSYVIHSAASPEHAVSGTGIEIVEREYRELRELLENTLGKDSSQSSANNKSPVSALRRLSARIGTAFHEVMERIDLKELTGIDELLRKAGKRNNLDGASRLQLDRMVEKCLASDLIRRARIAARTGGRVLRETPYIRPLKDGGVQEGRIDLLFEEEGVWTLVDYKTGRMSQNMRETKDIEAYFRNRYADQALTYRDALNSMSIKIGGVFLLLARTGDAVEIP